MCPDTTFVEMCRVLKLYTYIQHLAKIENLVSKICVVDMSKIDQQDVQQARGASNLFPSIGYG